jgi:hypothetical protein
MKKRIVHIRSYWIILVFIAIGIAILPLLKPGFFMTDDGDWMIIRFSAFYQTLREGQFPVRFLGRLNFSYGYPVANFLYPGFMYLGSFIHALGFSFEDTVKIIMGASFAVSGFFGFLWLRSFFGSFASSLGAITIPLAPYMLFDAYKRGSVGELLAMSVSLICLWAIERKNFWVLPLAYGFLLTSHNTFALMFTIVLVLYISIRKAWWAGKAMLIGLGFASFFWIPALYERRFVMFDQTNISNPFEYFATGETIYLLHVIQIMSAVGWLLFIKRKNPLEIFLASTFLLAIFFASAISAPFWSVSQVARIIQFPYRFLGIAGILGSYFVARVIDGRKNIWVSGAVFCAVGVLWYGVNTLSPVRFITRPEGYYSTNEATTTVADEYLPKWVTSRPEKRSYERLSWFKGNGKITPIKETTQTVIAVIEANEPSIIQINSIYYPGWGISVDGIPERIDYQNTDGFLRVNIPVGKHTVYAQFRETIPRFLADSVSVISLFVYVWFIGSMIRKRGKVL